MVTHYRMAPSLTLVRWGTLWRHIAAAAVHASRHLPPQPPLKVLSVIRVLANLSGRAVREEGVEVCFDAGAIRLEAHFQFIIVFRARWERTRLTTHFHWPGILVILRSGGRSMGMVGSMMSGRSGPSGMGKAATKVVTNANRRTGRRILCVCVCDV